MATQAILLAAFALSFAIKVPMFPLHTWLPDAHVEAPTAGSVILAGVLLKMGTYGFMKLGFPLFPDATHLLTPIMNTVDQKCAAKVDGMTETDAAALIPNTLTALLSWLGLHL
jgi:NADH-quinone oxidoreductase subunit M